MRFGRVPRSLPPNFPEVHTRWRRKQLTLQEAADALAAPIAAPAAPTPSAVETELSPEADASAFVQLALPLPGGVPLDDDNDSADR